MKFLLVATLALVLLPAESKVLAYVQSADGARIVLHDDAGPCVGNARLAEYIPLDNKIVQGCWLAAPGMVNVSFLDGERGQLPVGDLKQPKES